MTPRIGFRTAGFRDWPLADALRCLGELGYDGVELCLEHPQMRPQALREADCRDWARTVARVGLQIASVSYHGDREDHAARAANQVRAVQLAAWLDADVLILNARKAIPGRVAHQWGEFAGHLREHILPAAAALQVTVALEPEPGHFLPGSADLRRLIEELGHPSLAANLDVGHAWLTDPDLHQTVRDLAPWLVHLHWEDFPAGEHKHLPPGAGDMPLADLYRTLRAVGYDGYYTVDLFDIAEDPERHARESLQATRALFEASGG